MRAVHTRLASSPLMKDPWGDWIVLESEREVILKVVLNGLIPQA
jgi:hypothetical protein